MNKIMIILSLCVSFILVNSCTVDRSNEYHMYSFEVPGIEGKFEAFHLNNFTDCTKCISNAIISNEKYYEFKLFKENRLVKTYPLLKCRKNIHENCPDYCQKRIKFCGDYIIPVDNREMITLNGRPVSEIYDNECKSGIVTDKIVIDKLGNGSDRNCSLEFPDGVVSPQTGQTTPVQTSTVVP